MRTFIKKDPRSLNEPAPTVHPILPTFEHAARTTRHTTPLHTLQTPKSAKPTRKQPGKPS